jgi:hypothetical protein
LKTTNPVVVDIDHDGRKEILTSTYDGKLHCYWLDKTEHGQWPFSVYDSGEGVIRFSSEPAVADLNNDGALEVIFTSWPQYDSNKGGHLFIVNASGQLLHKVALPYGDNGTVGERNFDGGLSCPTIDDVDGDGEFEIILGTVYAGLVVYDLPGALRGSAPWPTGRHDYARTGLVDFSADADNLIVTRNGDGVYYLDSGSWVRLASPANQTTAGDLDGDGIDDLIGIWPTQGGVWAKLSSSNLWLKLSTTADWIGAGDMNGDRRADFVGTWLNQGVFYRDSVSGAWIKMASPAQHIVVGDLDGDGRDDLIGDWPAQGGVWVKFSSSSQWAKLSTSADWIGAGDMNGDGRDDFVGSWSGQGVLYRDSLTGVWVGMASAADQIAAGDLDGDGGDDLIGVWPTQGGVWVKYFSTNRWENLSPTVPWVAAGKMKSGVSGGSAIRSGLEKVLGLSDYKDVGEGNSLDLSDHGPGGKSFRYLKQNNILVGQVLHLSKRDPFPAGPGEPGFTFVRARNTFVPAKQKPGRTSR